MNFEQINQKYNTEFTNKLYENRHIFYEIFEACNRQFEPPCGSYLFDGQKYEYCDIMYAKQELLFEKAKKVTKVLEIGTYMGHSLLIMLLANPSLKITCIDISDRFAGPAVKVLNKYFNNNINFIHSDSLTALPKLGKEFDFFHVDGNHGNDYVSSEFFKILPLNNREDNILEIIFDDEQHIYPLQAHIDSNYKIFSKIVPGCRWSNVYYKIQL